MPSSPPPPPVEDSGPHAAALVWGRAAERALRSAERRVLERVAEGASELEVLSDLVETLERASGHTLLASILLLDASGERLVHGAAPSLPEAYVRAVDGIPIGPRAGSCGTAAFTGEEIVASDIATDPRWESCRNLALAYGLRACWSVPIRRPGGEILGTFAVYHEEPRTPVPEELALIHRAAHVARLAIERHRRDKAEEEIRLLYEISSAASRAERVEDIFAPTLDVLRRALRIERAAILLFDSRRVMRFAAWRGLSDAYREAVEGHSPWADDETDPKSIFVADARAEPSLEAYHELFQRERIGALGFIPLVSSDGLLGKLMVYDEAPRAFDAHEDRVCRTLAGHVALAVSRLRLIDNLTETVRFNEMFAGMLGHDLRNPLGAILTAAQLAMRRTDDERLRQPLSRIVSSSSRMARMIDELLDFTRSRIGGGIRVAPCPSDLGQICRHVLEELELQHAGRALDVVVDGDARGEWDPDRLAQVVSNLASNALEHGEPDSPVRVRIDGLEADRVTLEVHNRGEVPRSVLPVLFDPFRGPDPRRSRSRGLGLGLYITQQIARAHDGEVGVRSEDGSTTFFVRLPRMAMAAGAPGGQV